MRRRRRLQAMAVWREHSVVRVRWLIHQLAVNPSHHLHHSSHLCVFTTRLLESLDSMRLVQLLVLAACAVISSVVAKELPIATHENSAGGHSHRGLSYQVILPKNGLDAWYLHSIFNGPYSCVKHKEGGAWAMLNAYRSGGKRLVHWKYTFNEDDPECLTNWKYYESNGRDVIADSIPRTTTLKDSTRWCALSVHRDGGVKGEQWDDCEIRGGPQR